MTDYLALIHKDADSDYGVSFPDFPGCVTAGATLEEARREAAEALELHVAGLVEDGEALPGPTPLDDVVHSSDYADAQAVIVVPIKVERRAVRVNVTFDPVLLERIDKTAEAMGRTRAGWLAEAALAYLERR